MKTKFRRIFIALIMVLTCLWCQLALAGKKEDKKALKEQVHNENIAPNAPVPPKNAQYTGFCIVDNIDAKDGKPNIIVCKTADGVPTIYDRRKNQ